MELIETETPKNFRAKINTEIRSSLQFDELLSQLAANLRIHSHQAKQDCRDLVLLSQNSEYKPTITKIESAINKLNYQQAYDYLKEINLSLKQVEVENG